MRKGEELEITRRTAGRGRQQFHPGQRITVGVEFDLDQSRALLAQGAAKRPSPRPPRNKALAGPPSTKAKGPAPSRLSPFSEQEIMEEMVRRTQQPFIRLFTADALVQEVSNRHGGNGAHAFETDQLLEALHERGAVEKTDEPFEALTIALPSLAEVQARPTGKFDAFQADLRAVGVKGRSWEELASDYAEWIEGLIAPASETEEGGKPGPPPSPSPAPSEATPPKEDGKPA